MSSIKKSRDSDVQHVTSIDAQLNSMESYINADVYQALCFKPSHVAMVGNANMHHFPKPEEDQTSTSDPSKSLGVALIQPVTAGFEFCQIKRDLFPTKRSLSVNIESVSTMLSFEDLSLIETVLARLSSARSSKKPHEKNNKHGDLLSISLSESSEEYGRERNQPPLGAPRRATGMYMPESYQVTFDAKRLGLGLTTKGGKIIVNSIQDTRYKESIQLGDSLVSIGDFECIGCPLDDVVQELSRSRRPITLSFRTRNSPLRHRKLVEFTTSPLPEKMHDASNTRKFSIASYRIYFKKGVSTGFVLEPSSCGRFPVVTKVLPSCPFASSESIVDDTNAGQIEATLNHGGANIPRPGAVVVAVNDVKIEELGVETTWAEIKEMVDRVPSETDSHQYYSLSFREIDSSLWGNVDTIDLSSAGFALSFIDDLNGRDMPLFRAKVEALEAHAERGLGGRAQIIEVQPSSILSLEPTSISETSPIVTLDEDQIGDLKFESVLTVSGIAMCSVDYFHPRIAFWEPFVEPSQIFGILEMQSGSLISKRPGQVAVELSDRLLREQSFRANQLPSFGGIPKIVTVNLTDSSVEVAVKTISQWKDWRKSLQVFSEDEEGDTCSQMDADIELRESNPLAEVPVLATTTKFREDEQPGAFSLEARAHRNAKRAAKQRAAQAALVFAEKRGAGNSRKVDSAKPFVLRNRTGVSIAFVQENNVLRGNSVSTMSNKKEKNFAAVGEYAGLADYDPTFIHELGDKEDARFSMEIISDRLLANENHSITACHPPPNKVRNYEGCFPSLTIAIQAVSGVSINPLVDLQVYKVGSSVRHLIVRKDIDQTKKGEHDDVEYSIPVVWKVEIKDNRRVLTLSTAVRVVTTAFSTQMEVGVQSILNHECGEHVRRAVNSIGVVRPDSPFYLPLWLALKLEAVSVFVRPQVDEAARFDWGRSSILRFSPVLSVSDDVRDVESIGTWVWEETFEELDYVRCDSIGDMASPIWLAVFSGSSSNSVEQFIGSKTKKTVSSMNFEEEHHEVISVTLDSNVTLRNMLPLSLDWQLAHASYGSASPSIVDGSLIRRETNMRINEHLSAVSSSLHSGECTEVFACDFESSELRARFKEPNGQNWSSWAHLTLQNSVEDDEHEDDDDYTTNVLIPKAVQVNVQVINDTFGIPLTLGVRIVPKTTLGTLEEPSKTQIYGIEIIVYAELWIRNVTSLPLNFGCPSYQVHGHGESVNETFEDTATRFNAESALMEIANLLEVGDKGTGLSTKAARDVAITGGIESLPNQQCEELWEEVFEYLEIEYSTVKRRWWASESYDSFRMNITQSNETGRWSWIGENWVR